MSKNFRILPMGDRALTFEFGDVIDQSLNHKVSAAAYCFKEYPLEGVLDVVVTLRSFSVIFDPIALSADDVVQHFKENQSIEKAVKNTINKWNIPCCYEGEFAPDIDDVAKQAELSVSEVIAFHSKKPVNVMMMGFLPGFGYMGMIDEKIRLPRLVNPRTNLPAGSVAIAEEMTAIYPSNSPGGWRLIARCPLKLFDVKLEQPNLFAVGDQVEFNSINSQEFETISNDPDFDIFKECLSYG